MWMFYPLKPQNIPIYPTFFKRFRKKNPQMKIQHFSQEFNRACPHIPYRATQRNKEVEELEQQIKKRVIATTRQ